MKKEKREYKYKSEKIKQKTLTIIGVILAILIVFVFAYKGVVAYISVDSEAITKNALITKKNCSLCKDDTCFEDCNICENETVKSCLVENNVKSDDNIEIPDENNGEKLTTKEEIKDVLKNSKLILINKQVLGLLEGETFNLMVKTMPIATITYKSTNEKIATVDANGQITGKTAGTTFISVKAGSSTSLVLVTVSKDRIPVKSLTITNPTIYVGIGKEKIAFPVVLPLNTTDKVTYKSADENIAIVDEKGTITGINKGKTTITVISGDKTKKITVYCTTENSTKSIIVLKKNITLAISNSYQLKPTVLPTKTTDNITYVSGNKLVATVDETGKIKALAEGQSTIKIISGLKETKVTVNVKKEIPARRVVLSTKSIELGLGKEKQLKSIVLPLNSTNKITYVSTNPTVAEVNPTTGLIKASSIGNTTITAMAGNQVVTVNVKVLDNIPTKTLFINRSAIAINVSKSWKIKISKYPSNSTESINYKSTRESVAIVSEDGTITAVKRGISVIKITSGKTVRTLVVYVK